MLLAKKNSLHFRDKGRGAQCSGAGRAAAARQRGAQTISMSSPGVKKHVTYRLYVARSMPPTAVKHHNISALNSISFAVTPLGSDATKWCIPSTVNIRGSDFERYPFQISFAEQQAAGQHPGSRVAERLAGTSHSYDGEPIFELGIEFPI